MIDTIRALWGFFDRNMRMKVIAMVFMMTGVAFLEAAGLAVIFPILKLLSNQQEMFQNEWVNAVYRLFGEPSYQTFLIQCLACVIALFIFKNAVMFLFTTVQLRLIWHYAARMSDRLFQIYLRLPYSYHLQNNSASMVRNIIQSVAQIYQGALNPLMAVVSEILVVTAVFAVLLSTEPVATLTALFGVGSVMIVFMWSVRKQISLFGEQKHVLLEAILKMLTQGINGVAEIKVLGVAPFFSSAARRLFWDLSKCNIRQSLVANCFRPVLEVIAVSMILAVVIIAITRGSSLQDVIPILGLFSAAAFRLLPSFNRIANLTNDVLFCGPAVRAISDVLGRDPGAPADTRKPIGTLRLRDRFELSDVSFTYEGTDRPVLSSVSMSIRKGESVAFVGPSGAGKTTLANIFLGLLHPTAGQVRFDGEDITGQYHRWLGTIGYVPQDTYLLDDTLRRNIAFGHNDEEIDEAAVHSAISQAQLMPMIDRLPDGLDTMVGERGLRLSGGQKQRVAIARALYNDPDILVLDEATSSLDAETEAAITETINALHGTKTLIIIAHRLSTVKNCDRLFWFERGTIVDSGNFAELAQRNEKFLRMVHHLDLSDSLRGESGMAGAK